MLENFKPDISSYIQNLNEIIESMKPYSLKEKRKLEIAKSHIREIKYRSNKLLEQIRILEEEKIKMLEEKSNKEEK